MDMEPENESEQKCEADGKSTLTGNDGGIPDGTHPSTYTPENSSKRVIEDKTRQPGE